MHVQYDVVIIKHWAKNAWKRKMLSNSSNIIQIVKFVFLFYMYMHVTVINKSTVMFPVYKVKEVIAWFLKA